MAISFTAILSALTWRWEYLGQAAMSAAWFYLFPTYVFRWPGKGYLLFGVILGGYGNMKYFLLLLLFLFNEVPNAK